MATRLKLVEDPMRTTACSHHACPRKGRRRALKRMPRMEPTGDTDRIIMEACVEEVPQLFDELAHSLDVLDHKSDSMVTKFELMFDRLGCGDRIK